MHLFDDMLRDLTSSHLITTCPTVSIYHKSDFTNLTRTNLINQDSQTFPHTNSSIFMKSENPTPTYMPSNTTSSSDNHPSTNRPITIEPLHRPSSTNPIQGHFSSSSPYGVGDFELSTPGAVGTITNRSIHVTNQNSTIDNLSGSTQQPPQLPATLHSYPHCMRSFSSNLHGMTHSVQSFGSYPNSPPNHVELLPQSVSKLPPRQTICTNSGLIQFPLNRTLASTAGYFQCNLGAKDRRPCDICGDVAAGFHCNAYVCEACKKFFIRSSKGDNFNKYTCTKSNTCEINKDTRTHCQKCRYQKCLSLGMVLPGAAVFPTTDISEIPCRVCGAKSSGFHFGAITCEGCKGFFRRTINERENQRYTCRNGGNCAVTGATRNNCKSCRYRRCLAVGMSKDGSRIGRQPNAVKHRCAIEIEHIRSGLSCSTDYPTKLGKFPYQTPSVTPHLYDPTSKINHTNLSMLADDYQQRYTLLDSIPNLHHRHHHLSHLHGQQTISNPRFSSYTSDQRLQTDESMTAVQLTESQRHQHHHHQQQHQVIYENHFLKHSPKPKLEPELRSPNPNAASDLNHSVYDSSHCPCDLVHNYLTKSQDPNRHESGAFDNAYNQTGYKLGPSYSNSAPIGLLHLSRAAHIYSCQERQLEPHPFVNESPTTMISYTGQDTGTIPSSIHHIDTNNHCLVGDLVKKDLTQNFNCIDHDNDDEDARFWDSDTLRETSMTTPVWNQAGSEGHRRHDEQVMLKAEQSPRYAEASSDPLKNRSEIMYSGNNYTPVEIHPKSLADGEDSVDEAQNYPVKSPIPTTQVLYHKKIGIRQVSPQPSVTVSHHLEPVDHRQSSQTTNMDLRPSVTTTRPDYSRLPEPLSYDRTSNAFNSSQRLSETDMKSTQELVRQPSKLCFNSGIHYMSPSKAFLNRYTSAFKEQEQKLATLASDRSTTCHDLLFVDRSPCSVDVCTSEKSFQNSQKSQLVRPNLGGPRDVSLNSQPSDWIETNGTGRVDSLYSSPGVADKIATQKKHHKSCLPNSVEYTDSGYTPQDLDVMINADSIKLKPITEDDQLDVCSGLTRDQSNADFAYKKPCPSNGSSSSVLESPLQIVDDRSPLYDTRFGYRTTTTTTTTNNNNSNTSDYLHGLLNHGPNSPKKPQPRLIRLLEKVDLDLELQEQLEGCFRSTHRSGLKSPPRCLDLECHTKVDDPRSDAPCLVTSSSASSYDELGQGLDSREHVSYTTLMTQSDQYDSTTDGPLEKCETVKLSSADTSLIHQDALDYVQHRNMHRHLMVNRDTGPLELFIQKVMDAGLHLNKCRQRITETIVEAAYPSDETLWSHMMSQFENHAHQIICFARAVPGFMKLNRSDMKFLVQDGMYPITLIQLSRDFDSQQWDYNYFNFTTQERELIFQAFPEFKVVAEQLKTVGQMLKPLNMDEVETNLICCIQLVHGDRRFMTEPDNVQTIYQKAVQALEEYEMSRFHSDNRLVHLLSIAPCLINMNKEHQQILLKLKRQRPNLPFPDMYMQMFQLDQSEQVQQTSNQTVVCVALAAAAAAAAVVAASTMNSDHGDPDQYGNNHDLVQDSSKD